MIIGTTPTFTLTLPNTIDLGDAEHVKFTIEQFGQVISKDETEMTISTNVVTVKLDQEDTISFGDGIEAEIQLNWTYSDGSRAATKPKTIPMDKNLYKDVIE